jgi:hypothetical protein
VAGNIQVQKKVLNELLDFAHEITGSDRETALQLGVTPASLSRWRSRGQIETSNFLALARFVGFKDERKAIRCILVH